MTVHALASGNLLSYAVKTTPSPMAVKTDDE